MVTPQELKIRSEESNGINGAKNSFVFDHLRKKLFAFNKV